MATTIVIMVTLIHCCSVQAIAVVLGCGCLRAQIFAGTVFRGRGFLLVRLSCLYGCPRARISAGKFVLLVWLSAGAIFCWYFCPTGAVLRRYGCPRARISAGTVFSRYGCLRVRLSGGAMQTNLLQHFIANIMYHPFSLCSSNLKHTFCHRYHPLLFLFSLPFLLVATLRS
jgi:hypothetical protein